MDFFRKYQGWLYWFLACVFYFYEYYIRSAPSVSIPQLSQYFELSSVGIGVLAGTYYYSYAPAQIIAGVAIDRFGVKCILPIAILLCALGAYLFTNHNVNLAGFGRLLSGFGSGFAYVAILSIAALYIAHKHLGIVLGLTQAIGMFGAMSGQIIVVHLSNLHGWKTPYIYAAVFGVILTILAFFFLPRKQKNLGNFSEFRKSLKIVFLNIQTWLAGIIGGLLLVPTTVFAMLWGVPYFKYMLHLPTQKVSHITSMVFLGWIIGSPLVGFISDKLKRRKTIIFFGALFIILTFIFILYFPTNLYVSSIAMLLLGLFSGVQILSFALVHENNLPEVKGTATGICNFLIFGISAIGTPALGWLLHTFANKPKGLEHYTLIQYQHTLLVIPLGVLLSMFLLFFIKDRAKQ